MADYIDPNTKQLEFSVDVPQTGWIKVDPALAESLKDVQPMFIVIDNGIPREMTKEEKDAYIANLPIVPPKFKSKTQIMDELWEAMTPIPGDSTDVITEKESRAIRWEKALLTPSFQMMSLQLDGNDYANARLRGQELVAQGIITQDDYNILDGILPEAT